MDYKIINCNTLIKKITKIDALFHGNYCVDPYQNCEFGCQYCDSSFEKTIYIKKNSIDILKKELKSIKNGLIIIGSVHDPYQDIEKKFKLTKSFLETIKEYDFSCHILTKSPLILRDIDIIADINCLVTISISSLNDQVVHIFEPGVPSPSDRLHTIQILRTHAIKAGIALIPVLPYITEPELENIVKEAKNVDAQYLVHKHLELKGDQEQHFRNIIKMYYPHLLPKYDGLYKNNIQPGDEYLKDLNILLSKYCKQYNIPNKIII